MTFSVPVLGTKAVTQVKRGHVLQLCPDRSYRECYMQSSPIRVSVHWSRTFRLEAAPDPCQFLPHYETAHIPHGHDTD